MPSAHADISRRRVLLSAAALALMGATAAACGTTTPRPEVDDLTEQWDRARTDSALAAAVAAAQPPAAPVTRALNAVAGDRAAHAKALSDELARITGSAPADNADAATSTTAEAAPGNRADDSAPKVDDVVNALKESADRAAGLARTLSGYRAGLLGSIAASCTAAYTVALRGGAQ
ncbi:MULTISPECIES: hypothetical protein [Mycolicibacterium]|uniref:Tat pathway signal sequence domain-containing protein n=1 Tax=Mycolicibacterium senegalense TaxID=1796 RepID=A0A378T6N1_9MYCO|nr:MULTISPECIES: hypothetical protein [Mycolicibacterium]MCV7335952.1 hypothetical protein [Mycolicibacterium senegalense]MDR7291001.1 hypothetical protein [Mycolicibacterium senegalense]QZA22534.1 hypothetical protein K3U95_17480 [Mycolicibacterium senegalense]CDP83313.1 Tat pathway signal sequence domain-containing protein [Mycolicibacterium farcinogenes]STZ55166.1 Tat pathway signal sequence domain-containing protein [Mycolicibacterium senegalense]